MLAARENQLERLPTLPSFLHVHSHSLTIFSHSGFPLLPPLLRHHLSALVSLPSHTRTHTHAHPTLSSLVIISCGPEGRPRQISSTDSFICHLPGCAASRPLRPLLVPPVHRPVFSLHCRFFFFFSTLQALKGWGEGAR